MKENEVAAIVRGLAPRIREVIAEATTPLTTRLAEIEARPIEKGNPGELALLPSDLAEQVASAVRMLHESPDIVEIQREMPRPPKVTRIERDDDGNFVPVYDQPV